MHIIMGMVSLMLHRLKYMVRSPDQSPARMISESQHYWPNNEFRRTTACRPIPFSRTLFVRSTLQTAPPNFHGYISFVWLTRNQKKTIACIKLIELQLYPPQQSSLLYSIIILQHLLYLKVRKHDNELLFVSQEKKRKEKKLRPHQSSPLSCSLTNILYYLFIYLLGL